MQPKSKLMAKVPIGFNRLCKAQRDTIGHFTNRVACTTQQDFFQPERFDERFAFKQQTNPFKQQQATVQIAAFQPFQQPPGRLHPALVSDDGAGHSGNDRVGSNPCAVVQHRVVCARYRAVPPMRLIPRDGSLGERVDRRVRWRAR